MKHCKSLTKLNPKGRTGSKKQERGVRSFSSSAVLFCVSIHGLVHQPGYLDTLLYYAGVAVDIVGKYCYYLDAPLEERRVPVIVDVALIGRTKIIKLHSALWMHVRGSRTCSRPAAHLLCVCVCV